MSVDLKTQTHINTVLRSLPHLSKIIPPCNSKTTLHIDQYNGTIPPERETEIAESTIYEILSGALYDRKIALQIQQLEDLISWHPRYCTPEFGKHIIDSFHSRYSELEVYDALISHGVIISETEPRIIPENKDSKKADFKIEIGGTDIYIEVFTPRLSFDDEMAPSIGFYDPDKGIGNNTEEFHSVEHKVIREYEHHFKFVPNPNSIRLPFSLWTPH